MRLIGLRINQSETDKKVKKVLSQEWYPFFDAYQLGNVMSESDEELLSVLKSMKGYQNNTEKNLYTLNNDGPLISVHAIVGMNGCGKSTLLEIIFRLINNLAYATISDEDRNDSAPLYCATGISATLFYTIMQKDDTEVFCYLNSKPDGTVEIKPYPNPSCKETKEKTLIYHRDVLKSFFYSIIVNYSHYSLNTREIWKGEGTSDVEYRDGKALELFFKKGKSTSKEAPTHWLNGLFHKNDGYLTPATIHPMRIEGNFDVNKERHLSKTRLMGILVVRPEFLKDYKAKGFRINFNPIQVLEKLRDQQVNSWNNYRKKKEVKLIYNKPYLKILLALYDLWYKKVVGNAELGLELVYRQEVIIKKGHRAKLDTLNHIVGFILYNKSFVDKQIQFGLLYMASKSISISFKYNGFSLKKEEDMEDLVENIFKKHTHITTKIHQTIYHIQHRLLSDDQNFFKNDAKNDTPLIPIDKLYKESEGELDKVLERLYPPIYDTDIVLERVPGKKEVTLDTMSSGERQMLYSMSSVLYHLLNLKSVVEDDYRVEYHNVNVVLDEVEMYYHPEYQRQFLNRLLTSIDGLGLKKDAIQSINICIVTHSPFLLSDILRRNILFLKDGKVKNSEVKGETFGANIYDILKNGFFFDENALGCFANGKIKAVLSYANGDSSPGSVPLDEAKDIVEFIGDPMVKGYLSLNL